MRRAPLYLAWALFVLGVGISDIEMAFEPLGTFLVVALTGVAVFYRHILFRYLGFNVRRQFVLMTLSIAAVNVIAGLALNSVVDAEARDLITRIERYREKTGYFPPSLTDVADPADLQRLKTNHLVFGAKVAYTTDGKIFDLSYRRYLAGNQVWNQDRHEFQAALD